MGGKLHSSVVDGFEIARWILLYGSGEAEPEEAEPELEATWEPVEDVDDTDSDLTRFPLREIEKPISSRDSEVTLAHGSDHRSDRR